MQPSRRQFLTATAATLGTLSSVTGVRQAWAASTPGLPKIGMCDWSLGQMNPSAMGLGKRIGLDGIEVSVGTRDNNLWLRRDEIQNEYLAAAREHGMAIPSLAMGELNHVPLMSEPRAGVWVADAIEVARRLKVDKILLAFFAKGELKGTQADDMRRTIEVLAELAPRAEAAGVVLGIESYLSADDHLRIVETVNSPAVQVYYDVKNMADAGHDPIAALERIGKDRICQIHFKDTPYLEQGSGKVDWPATVAAIRKIGYTGWIILETPSPSKDVAADTKRNLDYVRRLFA